MSEHEQTEATVIELLLREPEIVAWLDRLPSDRDDANDCDDEPPRAA
jgi:hypothetical protein